MAQPEVQREAFDLRSARIAGALAPLPAISVIAWSLDVGRDAEAILVLLTSGPAALSALAAAAAFVRLASRAPSWPRATVPWDIGAEPLVVEVRGKSMPVLEATGLDAYAGEEIVLLDHIAIERSASPYRTAVPTLRVGSVWRGTRGSALRLLAARALGWLAWCVVVMLWIATTLSRS